MARRLDLFEGQLDLLELNLETSSELLIQITEFFRSYPDLYHHPKEELLLARLTEVAPNAASELFSIPSEHQQAALALVEVSHALKTMLEQPENARARFHAAAKAFIANERRHMRWEEKRFFVVSLQHLATPDWDVIEAKFDLLRDPAAKRETPIPFHRLASAPHAPPDLEAA